MKTHLYVKMVGTGHKDTKARHTQAASGQGNKSVSVSKNQEKVHSSARQRTICSTSRQNVHSPVRQNVCSPLSRMHVVLQGREPLLVLLGMNS